MSTNADLLCVAELELVDENELEQTPTERRFPQKGDVIDEWRAEFDKFYLMMRDFPSMESDEIFEKLAGISSRASEVRSQLVRMASRKADHFRTQECDFILAEVDRQFRIWSRCLTVRALDQELSGKTV